MLATTPVDFQFKMIVQQTYQTKATLTGLFGSDYAAINIVPLLLQLLVTGEIFKRFSVVVPIVPLPIGLFIGSLTLWFVPGLWAAAFVKTCDDSLSVCVNKSRIEVLSYFHQRRI